MKLYLVTYFIPIIFLFISPLLTPHIDLYRGKLYFNGIEAYSFLEKLVKNYSYRVVGTKVNHESAIWIKEFFENLRLKTYMQNFSTINFGREKVLGINVFAVKRGFRDKYIVLMAHRDIVPSTIQGANDNGAGVAILMELAKIFINRSIGYSLIFLCTDSEETGLHGARNFIEKYYRNFSIDYAISIDMCGWRNSTGISLYSYIGETLKPSDVNILIYMKNMEELGYRVSFKVFSPNPILEQVICRLGLIWAGTDSMPFIDYDIPSVGIGDYPLYPYWHKPEDSIDKVSPERLEYVGKFIEEFILTVDKNSYKRYGPHYLFLENTYIYNMYTYIFLYLFAVPTLSKIYIYRKFLREKESLQKFVVQYLIFFAASIAVVASLFITLYMKLYHYMHIILIIFIILYVFIIKYIYRRFIFSYDAYFIYSWTIILIIYLAYATFNPIGSLFLLTPLCLVTPLFFPRKKHAFIISIIALILGLLPYIVFLSGLLFYLGIAKIGVGIAWILYIGINSIGLIPLIFSISMILASLSLLYRISTIKYVD